jgi:hypothetical protein
MKTTVRATRAYLAGFGTSGSLLAGAAVLFVLASAIVAFRGWPQIATGPASVDVAASHPAAPSRVARRLATVLKATVVTGGAALAPPPGRRPARTRRSGSRPATGSPVSAPSGAVPASPGGSSATAVSAGGPSATTCAGACNRPGSSGPVTQLTSSVSQEVSNIGSSVGSGVSSTGTKVAGALNGVSPQAGGTVQNVGSSAGSAVSGTAGTAANAISQAGSALSGGH